MSYGRDREWSYVHTDKEWEKLNGHCRDNNDWQNDCGKKKKKKKKNAD